MTYNVLQAQDGSFIGAADVGDDFTPYIVNFDASGNVRWSVPNDQPQIATADGGVVGQSGGTYDQNGNATGQPPIVVGGEPTRGPQVSWGAQMYTTDTPGVSLNNIWVELSSSYWSMQGGNPSRTATSILNSGLSESMPLWFLPFASASNCRLGTDKIALGQEVLPKDLQSGQAALSQYTSARQSALDFLNSMQATSACATFLSGKELSVSAITKAITNQVPYDGLLSTLSMVAAGESTQADRDDKDAWPNFQKQPVCTQYWGSGGSWSGVVASAQVQPPGTDIYLATQMRALNYLTESTILHEALHNLTGLDDNKLYNRLSGTTCGFGNSKSAVINTLLISNGCASHYGVIMTSARWFFPVISLFASGLPCQCLQCTALQHRARLGR